VRETIVGVVRAQWNANMETCVRRGMGKISDRVSLA
jgi:hypothetical protein